jgi:hypothetical protein
MTASLECLRAVAGRYATNAALDELRKLRMSDDERLGRLLRSALRPM